MQTVGLCPVAVNYMIDICSSMELSNLLVIKSASTLAIEFAHHLWRPTFPSSPALIFTLHQLLQTLLKPRHLWLEPLLKPHHLFLDVGDFGG